MNEIFLEAQERVLTVKINKPIGTSDFFTDKYGLNDLNQQIEGMDYDCINLEITSLGGSVYDGLSIYGLLEHLQSQGKTVTTKFLGVNASAAVLIGMAGTERLMQESGLMLPHNCSTVAEGKVEDLEESVQQMKDINSKIVDIFVKKTNLSKEEVETILAKEKWMNSKEAQKLGFITGVLKTGKKVSNETLLEITNSAEFPDVNAAMYELKVSDIREQLSIAEDVDILDGIVDKLNDKNIELNIINNKLIDMEAVIGRKDSEINVLKTNLSEKEKSLRNSQIDSVLDKAIRQNKIENTLKENYRKLLSVDFENTKELIEKMSINRPFTLSDKVEPDAKLDPRFGWSFTQWSKEDPKGLAAMKDHNFDAFNMLYKEEFGKEYNSTK